MKAMILTNILYVKEDFLTKGYPYIPNVPRYCHSVAIITSGKMRYTINNHSIELSTGDVLFIRAGSLDCAETATDMPVHYIAVDFSSLEPEEEMKNLYCRDDSDLLSNFVKLLIIFQKHGENRLMECIEILYKVLNKLRQTDALVMEEKNCYLRISKAVEMVQYRIYDTTLTVLKMADACKISTVTLNHYFKKVYQMTASDYLLSRRMRLAKTLLLNPVNSIGDVAKNVGYGDIYAFSHAFSRHFGVSPSMWRNSPFVP